MIRPLVLQCLFGPSSTAGMEYILTVSAPHWLAIYLTQKRKRHLPTVELQNVRTFLSVWIVLAHSQEWVSKSTFCILKWVNA